jgi:class 3 adenylate cyclase/tetratricopeptide (TPR) repeat protein
MSRSPSELGRTPAAYTPAHLAEKILASRHAISGERKQVTVLFCDIVNSTSLAERLGPEAMHTLLDSFFERALAEVHRYEGTLNQFLGDGFMALFGAPLAHEDHARRAALTAWQILVSLREHPLELPSGDVRDLGVRMGLNSGFVVVGKIGDNLRMDYTAIGDTTNLASRLETLARPGEIYLSEATYRAAEGSIRCEALGTRTVKGKAEPVAVYRLDGVRVRPVARGAPTDAAIASPLVGRESEVAALGRRVADVVGGEGGIAFVRGEAGIGKSRLVAEVRSRFAGDGLLWIEGRSFSHAQTISYWPFLEIIRTGAGITEEESEEQSWTKLATQVEALFPSRATEVLPYLATLLGLRVKGDLEERVKYLDGRSMGAQILLSSRRFFEQLAGKQPVVLVFEDLHWIDGSSVELLEHLLPLVGVVPLLLIATARSEDQDAFERLRMRARELDQRPTEIVLSPLAMNDGGRLLEGLIGTSISPAERTLILRKADGNAFFLEELVRALITTGALRQEEMGKWRVTTRLAEITIPDTIQGVIMARIDRLEDDVKEVLKLGSVIGQSFLYRIIGALAGEVAQLDRDLDELQERELIWKRLRISELEYVFKHVLVQEATYGSILLERRRELHRLVGECIEVLFTDRIEEFVGLLAHHFAQAEEWEKAQRYLLRAGDEAGKVAADAEALDHYENALVTYGRAFGDRWDPLQRAQLERRIGEALFRRGQHEQAIEHLFGALALLGSPFGSPDRLSRRRVRLGIAKAAARQLGHRLVPRPKVRVVEGDAVAVVAHERYLAYEAVGWIYALLDHERFFLNVLRLLNDSERSELPAGVAFGSGAVGYALAISGLPRLARRYILRAVDLAEQAEDPVAIGYAHLALGIHGFLRADLDATIVECSRAAAVYKEAGHLRGWGAATVVMSAAIRFKGSFSDSLTTTEEILRVGADSGDVELRGWGHMQKGRVLRLMGDIEQGLSLSEESLRLFDSIPDYADKAAALSDIGMCHLVQGDPERALEIIEEAQQLIAERRLRGLSIDQNPISLAECLLHIAELEDASGRSRILTKAGKATRAALRHSKAARNYLPRASRVHGSYVWLKGDHAAARKWWERSLVAAEQSGARYDLGLTELEMGRRLNEPARLERAAAILGEIGAQLDLSKANAALESLDR